MRIIKLNATHSTNDYLKTLIKEVTCEDFTTVVTNNQTKGKGQMGNSWHSQVGLNLTFSVFKSNLCLPLEHQFLLNILTSLALYKSLKKYQLKGLAVKWPNDILADNKKIAGVLIENVIRNENIVSSVIGIGLNVNQTEFGDLIKASSIKAQTGIHYNLDEILNDVLIHLKQFFEASNSNEYWREEYNSILYRKEKPSTFLTAEGLHIVGIIKQVLNSGELEVLFEDNELKHFQFKEIKLLY